MSRRGVIISFDPLDAVGRILLDDGTEVRFGATGCVDFAPAKGLIVYVAETMRLPGGVERARSVHAGPVGSLSRLERAERKAELQARLDERILRELGASSYETDRRPVPSVRQTLLGCGVPYYDEVLAALDEAMTRDPWSHPFSDGWTTTKLVAWAPFDPAFIAFANKDGDALGFFCHPALLARAVPPPVVRFDHETHQLAYVSADLASALKSKRWRSWWESRGARVPEPAPDAKKWPRKLIALEPPDELGAAVRAERAMVTAILEALFDPAAAPWAAYLDHLREQQWPEALQARARAQWEDLTAEAAWNARRDQLRREAWRAEPEVFADELKSSPP